VLTATGRPAWRCKRHHLRCKLLHRLLLVLLHRLLLVLLHRRCKLLLLLLLTTAHHHLLLLLLLLLLLHRRCKLLLLLLTTAHHHHLLLLLLHRRCKLRLTTAQHLPEALPSPRVLLQLTPSGHPRLGFGRFVTPLGLLVRPFLRPVKRTQKKRAVAVNPLYFIRSPLLASTLRAYAACCFGRHGKVDKVSSAVLGNYVQIPVPVDPRFRSPTSMSCRINATVSLPP
jgi:hypothetical protein